MGVHRASKSDDSYFLTPHQLHGTPIPKCHARCIEFESTFDMKRERFAVCACEEHCPHRFDGERYTLPAETGYSAPLTAFLDGLRQRHLDEIELEPQD